MKSALWSSCTCKIWGAESHRALLSLAIGQPQPGAAGRAHCFGAQMSGECGTTLIGLPIETDDFFPWLPSWQMRVSRFYQRCMASSSSFSSSSRFGLRPQPRVPELSGHCRTSTASARCQTECQIECQNICQIECQIEWLDLESISDKKPEFISIWFDM